jgi:flagellin-like protein
LQNRNTYIPKETGYHIRIYLVGILLKLYEVKIMNKKGISPLIATVLLIVFSLVIGGMIMSWGRGQVDIITDSAGTQINIELTCNAALQKIAVSNGADDQLIIINAYSNNITVSGSYDGEECSSQEISSGASGIVACGSSGSNSGSYILTITTDGVSCGPVMGTV